VIVSHFRYFSGSLSGQRGHPVPNPTSRPHWFILHWLRAKRPAQRGLDGPAWSTTPAYDDGDALWEKVSALGLEGVVSKKRRATTSPAGAAGSKPRTAPLRA